MTGAVIGRELVVQVLGGTTLLGVLVGVLATWLRTRIRDTPSQAVLSLARPYAAFVPAYLAHASGVLATVVAGGGCRGVAGSRRTLVLPG